MPRNDNAFLRSLFFFCLTTALFLAIINTAHGADVTLTWDPNNEPDLAGYVLYSSPGAPGPAYDYVATYPLDAINPANPSCTIREMEADIPYYFVITAYDTNNIESGYSNEICVMNGLACSDEIQVENFVARFYEECLNRQPDPGGLSFWAGGLLSHELTGADVARGFIFSNEFTAKNMSSEAFLLILYKAFFDRDPDPVGFNFWLTELRGGADRGDILDGFLNSNEFIDLCRRYGILPN